MGQSKAMFTELQNEAATRSNPEFQNHVRMLKEEPNPVEVQQSALNAFNSMLDSLNMPAHTQAILRGFMMNYADCERLIVIGYSPNAVSADHMLMLSTNPQAMVS